MISRFYIALFVTGTALCSNDIDPNTLHNVFGYPANYATPKSGVIPLAQAAAVTPASETLTDPDYWDTDLLPTANVADYDSFDWTLTKRVASTTTTKESDVNMLVSPLGLKLALAILSEAATGLTRSELASALGFELDRASTRRKFSTIIKSLQKPSTQYILNMGSKIYVDESAQPRQMYAAIAQEFYKTDITPIDFHNTPVATKLINDWCANITEGRITNLVTPNDVAEAVVLIINTLFFKGSWRHQFAPNATKEGKFYATPKLQKPVQFMNVKDKFFFTESKKLDAKILRMPYQGNKFAMYVIVPNSLTGLNHVMEGLSTIRTELSSLMEHVVDVTLPKWSFEYTSQLDGVLKELGVRTAFEDTASFPGIARGQKLHQKLKVSKVLQRSGIEVNELGSVAYSITEIALENKFGVDDETAEEVIANKPFFFFIQDENTRQLLFTGRIADPSIIDGAFKL